MAMQPNSGTTSSEEFTPKRKSIPPMRYVLYTALLVGGLLLLAALGKSLFDRQTDGDPGGAMGAQDTPTEQSPNNEQQ